MLVVQQQHTLGRTAVGLAVIATLSFGIMLLDGGDSTRWWERAPASVFYATTFYFVPLLGLVAVLSLVASAFRKHTRR